MEELALEKQNGRHLPIIGTGSYFRAKRFGAKSDMLISDTSLAFLSPGRMKGAVCICECSWCYSDRLSAFIYDFCV